MKHKKIICLSLILAFIVTLQFSKSANAASAQWGYANGNTFYVDGKVGIGTSSPVKKLEIVGDLWIGRSEGSDLVINTPPGSVRLNTLGSDLVIPNGNVGIGTFDPTKKLTVNGTIRAKEIIVDTGWADYVFQPDYELISLSKLDQFIKENKHLPGIPTSAEVTQNGVELGNASTMLLQKIEELTLYTIKQQQEIDYLKNIILSK